MWDLNMGPSDLFHYSSLPQPSSFFICLSFLSLLLPTHTYKFLERLCSMISGLSGISSRGHKNTLENDSVARRKSENKLPPISAQISTLQRGLPVPFF